jgi:solute carrier family 35 protein
LVNFSPDFSFHRLLGSLNIRPYTFQDGRTFLPASIFFALHATLSLYAIHGMNIPMYGAIKRCTPLVSLILSVLVRKSTILQQIIRLKNAFCTKLRKANRLGDIL